MKDNTRHSKKRSRRTIAGVFVVLAVSATLVALPAEAGHKHKRPHKRHEHHVYYAYPPPRPPVRVVHRHAHFVVPSVIRTNRAELYRPYHRGRVYYAPHQHYHTVYRFPVYRDHGYVYEPHYYCSGELYHIKPVAYHGPHFSFSIAF